MENSSPHIAPTARNLKRVSENECYELSVDESKNRLHYCILGYWKNEECIPGFMGDWEKALDMVEAGFTILVDMRTMITHPQSLIRLHEEVQRKIKVAGVSRVANIKPADKIASLQVAAIAARTDLPYKNFDSMADAVKWLDQPNK